jgi:hypothetical protein
MGKRLGLKDKLIMNEQTTQLKRIADSLVNIEAILNHMVTEGLVTLPDAGASDN